jgi:hypothetical protein
VNGDTFTWKIAVVVHQAPCWKQHGSCAGWQTLAVLMTQQPSNEPSSPGGVSLLLNFSTA